jgi:hypothetical protein
LLRNWRNEDTGLLSNDDFDAFVRRMETGIEGPLRWKLIVGLMRVLGGTAYMPALQPIRWFASPDAPGVPAHVQQAAASALEGIEERLALLEQEHTLLRASTGLEVDPSQLLRQASPGAVPQQQLLRSTDDAREPDGDQP